MSHSISSKLQDPSLFVEKAYIDGEWVDAHDGKTFDVQDPATTGKIGCCPESTKFDMDRAIDAAARAFMSWKSFSGRQRSRILRRWFELVIENKQDLATIIAFENGKSRKDAEGEVLFAAGYLEWYSEEAARIYGDLVPHSNPAFRVSVTREPIGVCGMIAPWNFPAGMITRKVAPALAAGCTAIVKSDGLTPFSANALAVLAERAGIPKGCLNVVTALENTPELGLALCQSNIVRKISFTGSTRVGRILAQQSANTLQKLSLELGGNAPFIIFDDADLDQALSSLIACKWKVTGQTCSSANRIFVQEGIYDVFCKKLAVEVKKFSVGPSTEAATTHGPLIGSTAIEKTEEHIRDALEKNASIIAGGNRLFEKGAIQYFPDVTASSYLPTGPNFFEPTILVGVNDSMKIAHEETFGPIAPLFKFSSEDEVLARANNSEVGLAAYIITKDLTKAYRVADQLQAGMVAINTGIISDSATPFGGVKHSGMGREGGKYGIEEYLITKTVIIGDVNTGRAHL